MSDAQARREATLRRINGLKTSLARIVSSSSKVGRDAPGLAQPRHADPQALGVVHTPERASPPASSFHDSGVALRSLTAQTNPLAYLDCAQQEVERLTLERNRLMRTCAMQEQQLQELQVVREGAVTTVDDADSGRVATLDAALVLANTVQECYPALLRTSGHENNDDEQVHPSVALTRLSRVLPAIVSGSKLGDALSAAGADLLERVGTLEDEVETDYFRLLNLVDQLTTANESLKREAVAREVELSRLQAHTDEGDHDAECRQETVEVLLAEKNAAEARAKQLEGELSATQTKLRDLSEELAQQTAQLSEQATQLRALQDTAAESNASLTDKLTRKTEEATAARDEVEQLQAELAAVRDAVAAQTTEKAQRAATRERELSDAREAHQTSLARMMALQEENESLKAAAAAAAHEQQRPETHACPPRSLLFLHRADDSTAVASELAQDHSVAGELSSVSGAVDESHADILTAPQDDGDDSTAASSSVDRRTARRRASELVAAKRKTDQFRRQAEEFEHKLQEAEIQIRTLTAALERERMTAMAPPSTVTDDTRNRQLAPEDTAGHGGENEPVAACTMRRQENPLLINFNAVTQGAEAATGVSSATPGDAEPFLYPPGVDLADWMGNLVATRDIYTWADAHLSASDNDSLNATGALYHVGLFMSAAAHLWDKSEAERVAVGRLMLQVQRFIDHPSRPGDNAAPQAVCTRRHQTKAIEALRFCHVCLRRLNLSLYSGYEEDANEARMAFFLAAVCQFVYTDGHRVAPDPSSSAEATVVAHEQWQRVESLIEHVHRHDDAYPLFATEAMFERVTLAVRDLLTFKTGVVALALEVAFFPQGEGEVHADVLAAHRRAAGQVILLLSQSACLFRRDRDTDSALEAPPGSGPLSPGLGALANDDVRSLNSSLMGVTYSPTDAMVAHIDAIVLPLVISLARVAEPSLRLDLLSVLTCRGSLPFEKNRQWHVPNAVLDSVVRAALEADPQEPIVPVGSSSFLRINRELARLYRENVALRKTMMRVVEATEAVRPLSKQRQS